MKEYFFGQYYKIQKDNFSVAFIPAIHGKSSKTCSIQIVLKDKTYTVDYTSPCFRYKNSKLYIGDSVFSLKSTQINIISNEVSVSGNIVFSSPVKLKYNIMGFFKFIPNLQCRHMIYSMRSNVSGKLCINGKNTIFNEDSAYIEGDMGDAFPNRYIWTQCLFNNNSLMLSVADIPYGKKMFTGIICAVYYNGKHYRLATYRGRIKYDIKEKSVIISQGKYTFKAQLLSDGGRELKAPEGGSMNRRIKEFLSCKAKYRFTENGKTVFDFETKNASFEFEY